MQADEPVGAWVLYRREHDVLQEHIKGQKGQLQRTSGERGRSKLFEALWASFYPRSNWKLWKSSKCWESAVRQDYRGVCLYLTIHKS